MKYEYCKWDNSNYILIVYRNDLSLTRMANIVLLISVDVLVKKR